MSGDKVIPVFRYAAFGEVPGGGNPAGVVLDAAGLSPETMLAIAADVGYSETAFVSPNEALPGRPATHRIQYFSPLAEVNFCGHATIAAAVALAERQGVGTRTFVTRVGAVPIETSVRADGRVVATLTSPPTTTRPADPHDVAETLAALRWSADDIDPRFPAHVANAGNDHLVLAVASRERLAELHYDYDRLANLMDARGWTTLHLFWAESECVFHARDPFPPGGQVEDAATGAAAAAFAGYLRDLDLLAGSTRITIHQGEDMGRPSVLVADLTTKDQCVRVTGTANLMAHPHMTESGQ